MAKLQASQILVDGATLSSIKLDNNSDQVTKLIDSTKQKQADVLKLNEVDQEKLRLVVQL